MRWHNHSLSKSLNSVSEYTYVKKKKKFKKPHINLEMREFFSSQSFYRNDLRHVYLKHLLNNPMQDKNQVRDSLSQFFRY